MRNPSTPPSASLRAGLRAGLWPSNLRARLLALVLLAIIPLLGLTLYNAAERRALAADRAHTDALRIARLAAGNQAQFIEQARQMLINLAERPELHAAELPACSAVFSSLQMQYLQNAPRYANLGLIDADGKVYCSVVALSGPVDVSGQTYFQNAVQTLSFNLGDYEIDRARGQAVLNVAYPVLDFNGRARLVIFASLDLGWLNQLASQAQLPPGSTFTVTDRRGTILVHYPGDDRRIGRTLEASVLAAIQAQPGGDGTVEATDADGVPRLYAFSPLGSVGDARAASVSIGIPAREAFAEGEAILSRNLATLGLVALFALAVAWIAGDRFILRPVQALVHATRRLSAGDLGARSGLSRADQQGEIGQLAHAFDQMAEALQRRQIERERAAAELRRSEELYRTLARNFPNGAVILFDHDLRYLVADGAGLAEIGLSKAMLEGKTIRELFPADVVEILEPRYRAALAGAASAFEVPFAGRIYDVHALPIRDERGDIVAGMAMTQDITARKQAEAALREREEQYRSIFESTTDGLFINTLDGRLVDFNPAAATMHGYTPEEFRQLQPPQFIHPDSLHLFAEYVETVKAGNLFRSQAVDIRKDGSPFNVEVLGSGFTYRGQPHMLAVVRDITEQVRAQELLEQRVEERTHELRRRAEQFRIINEVSHHITSILSEDDLLAQTVRLIRETFSYYFVSIGLIEGDEVVVRYGDPLRLKIGKEGIIGWVAAAGEPLLVSDVSQEPRYVPSPSASRTRSELAVPIKSRGRVIGVLDVESDRLAAFDESDVAVVQALANQLAVAIENARLYESEQRRAKQFRVLAEVGRRITSILDVDQLLSQTVQLMSQAFGYYHVGIAMIEGDVAVYRAGAGSMWKEHPAQFHPPELKVGREGITGWVAGRGEPLLVPDVSQDSRYVWLEGSQTRSELALPILAKDRTIGVLDVQSDQADAFDQSDLVVLQSLANHLAVAIENARLYEQAQQLAALEERQKLARELHDSVSQALYGIALGAKTARTLLDRDPAQVAQPLDYVLSLAEAGLAEMRALIFELRPESLEMEGLVAALTKQTASLRARHNIEVRTAFEGEPQLPLPAKEALYRIAQEALNNIVKHARASRVEVRLESADGSVGLEIGDDGVGFDPQGEFPGHLGLQSMRERAEKVGGTLIVDSVPGQGTRIRVQVPGDRNGGGGDAPSPPPA